MKNIEKIEVNKYRRMERQLRGGYLPKRVQELYKKQQQEIYNNMKSIKVRKKMASIQMHECKYNNDDYCNICGLDGRA